MNDKINIVVVDDSAFMRKSLTLMLESDPEIKVVATARDGREGIEKIARLRPDLVTAVDFHDLNAQLCCLRQGACKRKPQTCQLQS